MSRSLEVRRARWAAFVERAVQVARLERGWTVARILEVTGIGKTTLQRWRRGAWVEDPEAGRVRDFCDALDIPPERAFRILWPGKRERAEVTEPSPLDPDVAQLARRLLDPNTPEADRVFLREAIKLLAARPNTGAQPSPRVRR